MASIWDPAAGGATVNANNTLQRQRFTAAEGQTDFTLTEFSYVPNTGSTIVFYNGAAQQLPTDYTELSASVIKLNFACNVGDLVDVIGFTGVSAIVDNIRLFNNTVIATAGQTEISTAVAYRAGTSSTALYENGVRLIPGVDYTETDNASFLTLTTPAAGGETYFSVIGQLVNDVGSDAALISYLPAGTGAVATTVDKQLDQYKSVFNMMTEAQIADVQGNLEVLDVTAAVQAAWDAYPKILVPKGTYMIKAHNDVGGYAGLRPASNSEIIFEEGAVFKAITNDKDAYSIINITQKENVKIVNCNLIGDRDTHTGVTGEFGIGVYILNSDNITIDGGNISKCWGDGIYLGQVASVGGSTNVTIRDVVTDDNRRQGMSVISVDGMLVENCEFSNTNGTAPAAGIDIEPNNTACLLDNITLIGVRTNNNEGDGILIDLQRFTDDPLIVNHVGITIISHKDVGSDTGLALTRCLNPTTGVIEVKNPKYKNNDNQGIQIRRWSSQGAQIKLKSPNVINPNRNGNAAILDGGGIVCSTLLADASPTVSSGNVWLDSPRVTFESGFTSPFPEQVSFRDTKTGNIDNVHVTNFFGDIATLFDAASYTDFVEATCSVSTVGNRQRFGFNTLNGELTVTEPQTFQNMRQVNSAIVPAGTTSTVTITFAANSLWRPALIKIRAFCSQVTTGTPNAASTGGCYYEFYVRHRTANTSVLMNQYNLATTANIALAITFPANGNSAVVTATTGFAGSMIGWDIEVNGAIGAPASIVIA